MKVVQEADAVNGTAVAWVAVGVVLVTAFGIALAWVVLVLSRPDAASASLTPARVRSERDRTSTIATGVFGEGKGRTESAQRALDRLHSYGFVDRDRQIVHVPIERAFDLYLERSARKRP